MNEATIELDIACISSQEYSTVASLACECMLADSMTAKTQMWEPLKKICLLHGIQDEVHLDTYNVCCSTLFSITFSA